MPEGAGAPQILSKGTQHPFDLPMIIYQVSKFPIWILLFIVVELKVF